MVMTWASLYIGWGTYMSVGNSPGDYLRQGVGLGGGADSWSCLSPPSFSRSGVFDWLLGRQPDDSWTFRQRFIREYSGMSLRGLVWTVPPGYALQQLGFGWEFSLSGSLMGLCYLLGFRTPASHNPTFSNVFGGGTATAEFYWGWWVWFVLCLSALSQLVRRCRVWIYSRDDRCSPDPSTSCQKVLYLSLNRYAVRLLYEGVIMLLSTLWSCSVVFYALVKQDDDRNKAQTFFGLFASCLFLAISQSWVWSGAWARWKTRRAMQSDVSRRQLRYTPPSQHDIETVGEAQPLLGAPPTPPPTGGRASQVDRSNTLYLPEGGPSWLQPGPLGHTEAVHRPLRSVSSPGALARAWRRLELCLWMDVFVLLRRGTGVLGALSLTSVLVTSVLAVWQGWDTHRFWRDG